MSPPFALSEQWNRHTPHRAFERNLVLSDEGLQLGKTLLAYWHKNALMLEEDRVLALLSVACEHHVSHSVINSIRHAEKSWQRGDKTAALIHLALTGVQGIDLEKAQRLFAAEWGYNRGVTPVQLLKFAGLHKDDDSEDDDDSGDNDDEDSGADNGRYNPDEPRIPAGQPGGGQWTTGNSTSSVTTPQNISIGFPPHLDEADSDFIGPMIGGAALAEVATSDALAALANRAQALVVSAMASVTAMGSAATDRAEQFYETLQAAINDWLEDNDVDSSRIVGSMQRFGDNDLVYGPSANYALVGLVNENGGVLLKDVPENMTLEEYSLNTLSNAAETGRQVHFDLTNMNQIDNVLAGVGKYANMITGAELRYIMDNWDNFAVKPKFYNGGWEVLAPWLK